ncbi:monocarboxylate transporter 9b [Brienomyrus brachyistius]|uniref:monocarboxylate transporter 9b n=1 Tax=Brienomyrus brachyistius TaxID=42636 RepID=UPI0020B1C613|nr:monocarboxylate transporter 9b [Brienomyrus brachyistius]
MEPHSTDKAPDGGWGWIIVLVSFMAQLLAYGQTQAVGVLFPEWLTVFQEGKGLTAWVGSLVSGIGLVASPVFSACVMNFGARPVTIFSGVMVSGGLMLSAFTPNVPFLIFSYGTVVGLGCGLVHAATVTMTCQYFDKKRGLALGIVTTGTNVGGFLYATAQVELMELYGLEWCLLIVGALALHLIACAGPMRPLHVPGYFLKQKAALQRAQEQLPALPEKPPVTVYPINDTGSDEKCLTASSPKFHSNVETAHNEKLFIGYNLLKVIKDAQQAYSKYINATSRFLQDRVFVSLCFSLFLFSLGASPPVLFMEDVAQSKGLIEDISVIPLVSIVSITTGLGKLVLGVIADVRWISVMYLYLFTLIGAGVALLVIPTCGSYISLQIISVVLGFFSGNWGITPYITAKIAGLEALSQAYGILMFFGGLGTMLGAPVVGWFFDWTQSYDFAFFFSGGCVLLGGFGLFLSLLPCWAKCKAEKLESDGEHSVRCQKIASVV